jgi:hypothetical protein
MAAVYDPPGAFFGYWLATAYGVVFAFGGGYPQPPYDLSPNFPSNVDLQDNPVVGVASKDFESCWVVTNNGLIGARGNASIYGESAQNCRGIVPTPSGLGYWLVTDGELVAFGDAGNPGQAYPLPYVGGLLAFAVRNNPSVSPRTQDWYVVGPNDQIAKLRTP